MIDLPKSRYLEIFQGWTRELKDEFILFGDGLIVEKLPDPEIKTKSGIVVTASDQGFKGEIVSQDTPVFVRVLAVGKGYYDEETGEVAPPDTQPGDIIMVGKNSVQSFSRFGYLNSPDNKNYEIGMTRESEIKMKFKGHDSFVKSFEFMNTLMDEEVQK